MTFQSHNALFQRRKRFYVFLSKAYTVLREHLKVRAMALYEVVSFKAFKIIPSFSPVSERLLGHSVHALRHTLQYNRSLPLRLHP